MTEDARPHIIFTIGHSIHPFEIFVDLLTTYEIQAVADVRSSPYSRYNPQFNRETLQSGLLKTEIQYVFLGDELGARRAERECYIEGQAVYEKIAELDAFRIGLDRVRAGAAQMNVALMCSERDPLDCHRAVLVGRQLSNRGHEVRHILSEDHWESQKSLEQRMITMVGKKMERQISLFSNETEVKSISEIEEAYQTRGMQIAYREDRAEEYGEDH